MRLATRVEALEAKQPRKIRTVHRFFQERGESQAAAQKRYEVETGNHVEPDDFVIVRVLV